MAGHCSNILSMPKSTTTAPDVNGISSRLRLYDNTKQIARTTILASYASSILLTMTTSRTIMNQNTGSVLSAVWFSGPTKHGRITGQKTTGITTVLVVTGISRVQVIYTL